MCVLNILCSPCLRYKCANEDGGSELDVAAQNLWRPNCLLRHHAEYSIHLLNPMPICPCQDVTENMNRIRRRTLNMDHFFLWYSQQLEVWAR